MTGKNAKWYGHPQARGPSQVITGVKGPGLKGDVLRDSIRKKQNYRDGCQGLRGGVCDYKMVWGQCSCPVPMKLLHESINVFNS